MSQKEARVARVHAEQNNDSDINRPSTEGSRYRQFSNLLYSCTVRKKKSASDVVNKVRLPGKMIFPYRLKDESERISSKSELFCSPPFLASRRRFVLWHSEYIHDMISNKYLDRKTTGSLGRYQKISEPNCVSRSKKNRCRELLSHYSQYRIPEKQKIAQYLFRERATYPIFFKFSIHQISQEGMTCVDTRKLSVTFIVPSKKREENSCILDRVKRFGLQRNRTFRD